VINAGDVALCAVAALLLCWPGLNEMNSRPD
jgi:hypothetical protein